MEFFDRIHENPVIAAVNHMDHLEEAIESPSEMIFLLTGDIFNIKDAVGKIQNAKKMVFVHVDLLEGFSKDAVALEYIAKKIKPDGIITTKTQLARKAMELGLFTIQRFFILDSLSLKRGIESMKSFKANAIEILPGINDKITKKIVKETSQPVITGGLIMDKEDVIHSLQAGAIGISTTKKTLWYE
ncbi:MAG: glycerol-3-phosphate responsive antiterminator [Tissierellales bacterium]|nr:glycerol-3-phosphate responsive antiterminator [Tissierellales bacterium]